MAHVQQATREELLYALADRTNQISKLQEELEIARKGWDRADHEHTKAYDLLIMVVDQMEYAAANIEKMPVSRGTIGEQQSVYRQGVLLLAQSARDALRSHGIERLVPQVYDPFDARWMEALCVSTRPGITQVLVAKVLDFGYQKGDWLIRPARVDCFKPA